MGPGEASDHAFLNMFVQGSTDRALEGKGPVLLTGDASHTRWGWAHDVEPGTFSGDIARSAESFKKLRKLVAEHPSTDVRFGHQR